MVATTLPVENAVPRISSATEFSINNSLLTVDATGNVGAPVLAVGGTVQSGYLVSVTGGAANNGIYASVGGNTGSVPFHLETSAGSNLIHITPDGKVGLGTVTPSYGLDIQAGTGSAGSLNVSGDLYRKGKKLDFFGLRPHMSMVSVGTSGSEKVDSSTYTVVARTIFDGSSVSGAPTGARAIVSIEKINKPGSIRLYDASNNMVISEITNITNLTPTLMTFPTLANISTSASIWEVQCKSNDKFYFNSVDVNFHEE